MLGPVQATRELPSSARGVWDNHRLRAQIGLVLLLLLIIILAFALF